MSTDLVGNMTEMAPAPYFVCATPRSGSTLFCEALRATGVAGRPAEYFEALRGTDLPRQPQEYFDVLDPDLEALLPRFDQEPTPQLEGAASYLDYLLWVRQAATTDNGVFAAKLMWGYLGEFATRLRETGRYRGAGDLDVIADAFPGARYVRVVRLAKVEQAVSLWTAIQTQTWRHGVASAQTVADPVYHRGAIDRLVRYLTEHEDRWSTLFAQAGIEPFTVIYEDLVRTWDDTLRRTLEFLRIPQAQAIELPHPPLERQADKRSRQWVQRFIADQPGTPASV
jgi:trehalose 2-sulfotransferase